LTAATCMYVVQNNQEFARSSVDAVVDQRTHVEIYLPPFEAAVDAGVGSVMCRSVPLFLSPLLLLR